MYSSLFEAGILLGPLTSPAKLETPESLSTEDVSTIVQVFFPSGRRLRGQCVLFSVVFTLSPPSRQLFN
jgi:hypothetical protein